MEWPAGQNLDDWNVDGVPMAYLRQFQGGVGIADHGWSLSGLGRIGVGWGV